MKYCVITGAADGIGRALAERFVVAGCSVVGIDRDVERAERMQAGRQDVSFVIADLGKEAGLDSTLAALCEGPPIDVLVHNAGISAVGRLPEVDVAAQEAVLAVNLYAPMVLTAELLRAGKIAQGGTLVFISSLSHFSGYPGAAAYAASKSGLASYARSLRVALASQGFHVLTVFPGPTRTTHAKRYSPDNSRENRRMPPEDLAERIFRAIKKRRRMLVPGLGNRIFAMLGLCFPRMTDWMMERVMLKSKVEDPEPL